ncbi:hypothetical protein DITRI_Ditri01bG0146400 [Diplodiscus trichospermus]
MGVEILGSDMAQVSVDKVTEVDKSFLHEKENGKLDKDPVHNEPTKVGSHGEEADKGEENNASDASFLKDAAENWPAPKQIHYFYFVRYRPYDDPKIKAKIDQADKEMQKWNKARFQLTDELKAKRIYSLQYRIQHESIPLAEEKQLLREIKQLEGTREKVIANAAMRAKIQDSLGQKEAIQDQVKLMGVDLDGVRKEQQAVWSKKNQIKEKVKAIESKIDALQEELTAVTQKREKAYETIQGLRKQRDEGNAHFYQSRSLLSKAKELAANKDVKALEELSTAEVEKFTALWSGKKAFRDDYEKRILSSLDSRQLSRDGRIRNPDEKPLIVPEAPVPSVTETIPKPSVRQPNEEAKSSPQPDTKHPKKVQKDAETKVMESKSSSENGAIADKEISVSSKLLKDSDADKEVDAAKLKEKKREEEIAKAKQAMERKKKLAEKAAAKAAIRALKEAEKKLKEIIIFSLSCFAS